MSLSKLSSTSGGSSQIAFNGQNVFSERQHPLLLPTVLDAIFPYLTFKEVKSSRLVCKPWAEVGIPFIGRKKLKPVKFSNVTHKDFVALIKEFEVLRPKPHPKLKLFQGFRLTWEEVGKMSYCNFMPSFKPSELAISGRNISDPSTSLISLLQPVLTTLTNLSLNIILDSSDACSSFTALLNNFTQLQPMTLKTLRLKISADEKEHQFTHQEMDAIYRAFEVVFQSQSPTLEKLELNFECVVSRSKNNNLIEGIELPVFPSIQHLSLSLDITEAPENDYLTIFTPFDFCEKFPQLVQLDILDATLNKMDEDDIILNRGHPLMKKLNLSANEYSFMNPKLGENIDIFENLHLSFPHIEELRIEETPLFFYLFHDGIEISWVDTLRILECSCSRLYFNFGHLKKLEYLQYTIVEFDFESEEFQITSFIEMLLEHYRQLPHLKLFHLISGNLPPPEKMNQILEALPEEFRVIFKFTGYIYN